MVSYHREYQKRMRERYSNNTELLKLEKPNVTHGKNSTYVNYGCRCDECLDAHAAFVREAKKRRAARPTPEHVHGTPNGYGNYMCRCRPCTDAWSADTLDRDRRRAKGLTNQSTAPRRNKKMEI